MLATAGALSLDCRHLRASVAPNENRVRAPRRRLTLDSTFICRGLGIHGLFAVCGLQNRSIVLATIIFSVDKQIVKYILGHDNDPYTECNLNDQSENGDPCIRRKVCE